MATAADIGHTDLELRLLGQIEVLRGGERQALPQSKKTRALLAYLAMSGRSHRRERLCDLLWDVADDPRGALRWSLSKLRRVVNDETERIAADRENVAFVAGGAHIDAVELIATVGRGVGSLSTEELERLAELARGEFLDGLELPDFHEFQSWCVAAREQAREARGAVLAELTRRLRHEDPRRALPYARARVQADVFNVPARAELLRLLVRAGKRKEAEQQFEIGRRMLTEVGASGVADLEQAWLGVSSEAPVPGDDDSGRGAAVEPVAPVDTPFVGRRAERERLVALHDGARERGNQRVALISGEPGGGKSRLAEAVIEHARAAGSALLYGRAYEAESSRPYGPWVDALGTELADFAPERGDRDALFAAVADATATRAVEAGGALLVLDDVQWLDSDSAELLHFVARMNRQRPVFVLLIARSGELADNEPMLRALRSLRREVKTEELLLAPLSRAEVGELLAGFSGVDADHVFEASAGNPMYALELARAAEAVLEESPTSLVELVRERVDRLPPEAADVLRWGAVLGHAIDVGRLETLSSLDLDQLVDALECLERHALLRVVGGGGGRYEFSHDVVREAVYGELSHPRRRLMHQQVARLLAPDTVDASVATEVAHHASLAGDAILGVKACVAAGRQSLRVFANGDATALARRGLRLVDDLEGGDRIGATIELLSVLYAAHKPDRERAIEEVRELTDRALDLGLTRAASLGFHLIAYLRWEGGNTREAHESMMQAERVSRSADPRVRSVALGEAAKCLLLLEKNLEQAEAFVLEADALADRGGRATSASYFATGMLSQHRGDADAAIEAYREARRFARQEGDRIAEFYAVEHWTALELDRGHTDQALALAAELVDIGSRVREGSEEPCARAMLAFAQWIAGDDAARTALDAALEDLRLADGKYRLCLLLSRCARVALERGDPDGARAMADDALELATAIGRPSEMALARAILARIAEHVDDTEALETHIAALDELRARDLSYRARQHVEAVVRN